jgi:hypothetical protein
VAQTNGWLLTTLQLQALHQQAIPVANHSQPNKEDADEDTDNDEDDSGSISEWSTNDCEYMSVDSGKHLRMGWVVNNPLSVDYYKIIILKPTYTMC